MISKLAIFGFLFAFGFADGRLIEIDESHVNKDYRRENSVTTDAPFGQSDFGPEDGGLEILGPKNPNEPGDMIGNDVEIETDKGKGNDKTTEDPWKQFYDPHNKNPFGQSFPAPEDVPQVPKRPANHFPNPETERPFGGQGQNNGGFGVVEPETSTQGYDVPNHGGFENYPTHRPTHGTFEPYPTDDSTQGHHVNNVPSQGGFDHYPTHRPTHATFEPYPTDSNEYYEPNHHQYPQNPHYHPEPTTENYNADKDKHFPQFGGILGWGKYTTKKPHKWGHNGGILGGILGGWKDKHHNNNEAIDKASNSVKEAGEKVVDAGKDILEAGWEIGGNLFNPLKPQGKKHHAFLGKKHHSLLAKKHHLSRLIFHRSLSPVIVDANNKDAGEIEITKA